MAHNHFARILAVSMGVLAACAPSADDPRLKMGLPDSFHGQANGTATPSYSYKWWQDFEDPVLNRLIEIALEANPTLGQAQARVREAEAQARALRNRPEGTGELTVRDGEDTGNLDAQWSLFGGREQRARAAIARLEAARFGSESAHLSLAAEIATAYVELRFLQQISLLRQQDLRSRSRTLENSVALAEQGNATRLDVVRARALLTETRSAIATNSGDVAGQKQRISTLVGRPLGLLGVDLSSAGIQPRANRILTVGVPADLVRGRRDILQAEALYNAAILDLGAARAARYPTLTLAGNIVRPLEGGDFAVDALASVALPIFQQPSLAATADAAHARAEQAYAQWTSAVLVAVEEVETALAALQSSSDAMGHARSLVSLNNEALDLTRQLITLGDATVLDLLDSERDVTRARQSFAESQRNHSFSVIGLYRALGVGVPSVVATSASR